MLLFLLTQRTGRPVRQRSVLFLCKKPAVLPPVILFIFLFLFFGSLVFSLFSVLIAVIGLGVKGGDITLVVIFDLYL